MGKTEISEKSAAWMQYLCSKLCHPDLGNFSQSNFTEFSATMFLNDTVTTTNDGEESSDVQQKDALLYIIVVLLFYSFGIIVMLVGYVKRERQELEEEIYLQDFLKSSPPSARTRRGCSSGKLALFALNAASSVTQPTNSDGKVTFV